MKTLKLKKPKLPRCPNMKDVRGSFSEISAQLRAARHKYIRAAWDSGGSLVTGTALATFVGQVAEIMQKNGLYSPKTNIGDLRWSVVSWFFRYDCPSQHYKMWLLWLEKKSITRDMIKGHSVGRGHRKLA